MILYTSVPPEFIYPFDEQVYTKQKVVNIKEGQLIVEQVSPHEYRIVRLLSTDPMAYLNEDYSPGKMFSLLL